MKGDVQARNYDYAKARLKQNNTIFNPKNILSRCRVANSIGFYSSSVYFSKYEFKFEVGNLFFRVQVCQKYQWLYATDDSTKYLPLQN